MLEEIRVSGARQHNLKNISVRIPRNTLTVITGLSGSGKSSLAFDTIYAEGQRRYVETLSAFARQFLDQMERPDVDAIDGLSPSISIDQKTTGRSPRSTVGTITEIYDYLRLLYSSIGVPHCPVCGSEISRQTTEQILKHVLSLKPDDRILVMAPVVRGRKGEFKKELEKLARQGLLKARIDGVIRSLEDTITLDKRRNHTIEVIVDRLLVKPGIDKRLEASIETATRLADGLVLISVVDGEERLYSRKLACVECGTSVPELEPRSFSFNSPYGACEECAGIGNTWAFDPDKVIVEPSKPLLDGGLGPGASSSRVTAKIQDAMRTLRAKPGTAWEKLSLATREALLKVIVEALAHIYRDASDDYKDWLMDYMSPVPCPVCEGKRLRASSLAVRVKNTSIAEFTTAPISRAMLIARSWKLTDRETRIAGRVVDEIRRRLEFLESVGLHYLSLDRSASTLSGGEAQRIRLATQIGSKLRGVLYVLDEPSIGLHPRDNNRLLDTLTALRDMGNTVLVVEHDAETIERADYVIDLGPGAGRLGGVVVGAGTPDAIRENPESLTGRYLAGTLEIPVPARRRPGNGEAIQVRDAREHNLKGIDVEFPLGRFIAVTGVSGSGKSTLVNDILYRALAHEIYGSHEAPGAHGEITGIANVDKVIRIDQSPIGRTPRSNPATYTGLFTPIRDFYAMLPESRERGYKPGRFSFNVKGGRCEACQGDGLKRIEMNFLPDVYVTCDVCRGKRYNYETLQVKYKGHSIADLLALTIEEALPLLETNPQIRPKLQTLLDVGLGYVHLGQSSTTLSGGEAQRIKLSKELSKRQTGRTFYVLDEPTTGLHFEDVRKLLEVLQRLVDLGNTVLVIEHNLDVIKSADWVIDLGPDGGEDGGRMVVAGTPEQIMKSRKSFTAEALRKLLKPGRAA
ncbi:MAG TPA: excinuclease ABC subunit UvrA [Bryobacteraceae bacterium]|jgi:excinuclease ABC subunit A|nr:excinuclease ABC subunit UvrA [Bryobacteraceae bacterium]